MLILLCFYMKLYWVIAVESDPLTEHGLPLYPCQISWLNAFKNILKSLVTFF